jgi:hypothetical protein
MNQRLMLELVLFNGLFAAWYSVTIIEAMEVIKGFIPGVDSLRTDPGADRARHSAVVFPERCVPPDLKCNKLSSGPSLGMVTGFSNLPEE